MKATFVFLFLIPIAINGQNQKLNSQQYKEDFNYFWTTIHDEYCYFDKKQTDWEKVKVIYSPSLDTIATREQFIALLERGFYEIYDHHASLNTNTDFSQKLVPSGTAIWAEYRDGKPIITEIKQGSNAMNCGIMAGMEVIAVNDIPVDEAIKKFLPKSTIAKDSEMKSYALRVLLAGNHIQLRKLTLKNKGIVADFFPDNVQGITKKANLRMESSIHQNIGYLKINDCLYDNALIAEFDSVMKGMKNTKSLILDLRNTPSGGNTMVAKAILSWFISKDHFYQKHEYTAEEKVVGIKRSWMEIVSPRSGKYYSKPLVLLVDHWTGSIAEGITIGFDGLHRPKTKIIGTTLARLNGAVTTFEMPNSKIRFSIPNERLFHINGKPRELFRPEIYIDLLKEKPTTSDLFMTKAFEYLNHI